MNDGLQMRSKVAIGLIIAAFAAAIVLGIFFLTDDEAVLLPPLPEAIPPASTSSVERIGTSVAGRAIDAYTYGTGDIHLLFVGGMHGGYEWNSVLLAYAFIDHLEAHPEAIPNGIKITVVPMINPDGVFAVIGKEGRFALADAPATTDTSGTGRFNDHGVDLNRNFDCKWQPESTWRGQTVSAGTRPFSEPEAAALRDWVQKEQPAAAVFWHSQANAVYASECTKGILPETLAAMSAYASAAGYPAVDSFDAYPISGDAEGWLASVGIPAITVELKTHETIEWERNLAGIQALIAHFAR